MTINELIKMLNEEVKKGNGDKKVGYTPIFDPWLTEVKPADCGFYTETCYAVNKDGTKEKICESTMFIIGNYQEITEELNGE